MWVSILSILSSVDGNSVFFGGKMQTLSSLRWVTSRISLKDTFWEIHFGKYSLENTLQIHQVIMFFGGRMQTLSSLLRGSGRRALNANVLQDFEI